jgi:hypothetical protein
MIATMPRMRDLDPKYKLTFRSLSEVNEALGQLVVALRARGPAYRGKRITQEAALNALILALDEDSARVLVGRGIPRLEAILRGDPDPGPPRSEARALGPGKVIPRRSGDKPDDADSVDEPDRRMRRPER